MPPDTPQATCGVFTAHPDAPGTPHSELGGRCGADRVQRNELVDQPVEVEKVDRGHAFDLPADEMTLPVPSLVLRRSIEEQVIRMHIDLDAPPHCWDRKIQSNPGAVRQIEILELRLDRNSARSQRFAENKLGMRLGNRSVAPIQQRLGEQNRAWTSGMAQPPSGGAETLHRALLSLQQLLNHRRVIQR